MKINVTTALAAIFAFVAMSLSSCSDKGDNNNNNNGSNLSLLKEAEARPELAIFVQALNRAELAGTFNSSTILTVFAPTNSAFNQFLGNAGYATVNDVPVAVLRELLLNHTLIGDIERQEILTGYRPSMAKGPASTTNYLSMYLNTDNNSFTVNGYATVIIANIDAKNGKMHMVDQVIAMPTVYSHIEANPDLAVLKTALNYNSASGFQGALSGDTNAPFTLFAPVNNAFSSYFTETNTEGFAAIDAVALQTTLQYHVVAGTNISAASLTNNQTIATLAGQNLLVTLTGGGKKLTDVNSRVATIIKADVQAVNGVVHVIDKVLMPN
jgi:uncharacterized surface protein with fasciclin (FAS1) repeats